MKALVFLMKQQATYSRHFAELIRLALEKVVAVGSASQWLKQLLKLTAATWSASHRAMEEQYSFCLGLLRQVKAPLNYVLILELSI